MDEEMQIEQERDYQVRIIEGLVQNLEGIRTLLGEYEEVVGESPRIELAYVVDRFDDVVGTLHEARVRSTG